MRILLLLITLFLISCSNYDQQITIEKNSFTMKQGYDGLIAEHGDRESDKVYQQEGEFVYEVEKNLTISRTDSTTKYLLFCDTVGDTIRYVQTLFCPADTVFTEKHSCEACMVQIMFLGKNLSASLTTDHPIVWTNGDLQSEKRATLTQKVTPLSIQGKRSNLAVKVLYRGEPNKIKQKGMLLKTKAKGFFARIGLKIKSFFSKLFAE